MASNLFGGLGDLGNLGGLVKGLSNIMPQDDPNVKIFTATSEVSDLKKQETEVYAEIGRMAVANGGGEQFGELGNKLALIQANLASAEAKLNSTKAEAAATEKQQEEEEAGRRCPGCGTLNPEGTKFCQECGGKLGAGKLFCTSCGAENAPGTRFCGECGTKLGE